MLLVHTKKWYKTNTCSRDDFFFYDENENKWGKLTDRPIMILREASKRTLYYPFGFHLVHDRDWILILIQK